jgi:hypothetical protein
VPTPIAAGAELTGSRVFAEVSRDASEPASRSGTLTGARSRIPTASAISSMIRTLATLTIIRGASRGATGCRHQATPRHSQRLSLQLISLPSHTGQYLPTLQMCLLSSGSRVRILPGAPLPGAPLPGAPLPGAPGHSHIVILFDGHRAAGLRVSASRLPAPISVTDIPGHS